MGFKKFLLVGSMLGCAGILPAAAQAVHYDSSEQITVTPPTTMQEQSAQPMHGGPQTQTFLAINQNVDYSDLDLSKTSDRTELNNRIIGTAQEACGKLDARYPQTVYVPIEDQKNCVGNASHNALAMVDYTPRPSSQPQQDSGLPQEGQ